MGTKQEQFQPKDWGGMPPKSTVTIDTIWHRDPQDSRIAILIEHRVAVDGELYFQSIQNRRSGWSVTTPKLTQVARQNYFRYIPEPIQKSAKQP